MKKFWGMLLGAVLIPLSLAAQENGERELKKITFACHWLPQAQFAGFYMAKQKGFYRKYGMDVDIVHATATVSNTGMLKDGKAQFASFFLAAGINMRANGMKIVNIGQFVKHSSLIIVARKSEGIESINDLNGKSLGVWLGDFQDTPRKFLREHKLNSKIVNLGSGVDMFLWKGVDAQVVTIYNELHSIYMAGVKPKELSLFKMNKYKLDIPEEGIYCKEDFFSANPELCRNFVRATVEGWKYAFNHEKETLEYVTNLMKRNRLPLTKVHQQWMLRHFRDLMETDSYGMQKTGLSESMFNTTADLLKDTGKIKTIPAFNDFYKGGNQAGHLDRSNHVQ